MRVRRCNAACCLATVTRHHLMCPRHWSMVPVTLQLAVTNHYRADCRPQTLDFFTAAADAIEFVASIEKHPLDNPYRRIAERMKARAS